VDVFEHQGTWDAVVNVATALLKKNKLDGKRVHALIEKKGLDRWYRRIGWPEKATENASVSYGQRLP
jgi:hypothetical protein